MDIERIREFSALSDTLNFTETARRLHVSQSSLSRHMQELEVEVGAALIQRGVNGGRATLTPAGRRLLELGVPWADRYGEIINECRELANRTPPARIQRLDHVLSLNAQIRRACQAQGREWEANFTYVDVNQPLDKALDSGAIDFALWWEASPTPDSLEDMTPYAWIPLDSEPLCFLAGTRNPFSKVGSIPLKEIGHSRIVTLEGASRSHWEEAAQAAFTALGCRLTFVTMPNTPAEGGAFPIGPHNLVLNTRRSAQHYIDLEVEDACILEVEGFSVSLHPFLLYRKDNDSPAARKTIEALEGNTAHPEWGSI